MNITQLIIYHIISTMLINNLVYMCVNTLKFGGLIIINKTWSLCGCFCRKFYYNKTYDEKNKSDMD